MQLDRERDLRHELSHELDLVGSAIEMVSSHLAPRVTVAGLRLGDEILDAVLRMAAVASVRVTPLERAGGGIDIAVEAA